VIRAVLADAGPLYAAVDEADERHKRASDDLLKLERERRLIIVAYPTLLEARARAHQVGESTDPDMAYANVRCSIGKS
jgi:hypothetical protein